MQVKNVKEKRAQQRELWMFYVFLTGQTFVLQRTPQQTGRLYLQCTISDTGVSLLNFRKSSEKSKMTGQGAKITAQCCKVRHCILHLGYDGGFSLNSYRALLGPPAVQSDCFVHFISIYFKLIILFKTVKKFFSVFSLQILVS